MKKILIASILVCLVLVILNYRENHKIKQLDFTVSYSIDSNEISIKSVSKNRIFDMRFVIRNDTLFNKRNYFDFDGTFLGSQLIPYVLKDGFVFYDKKDIENYPPVLPCCIDDWKVYITKFKSNYVINRFNLDNHSLFEKINFNNKLKIVKVLGRDKNKIYLYELDSDSIN